MTIAEFLLDRIAEDEQAWAIIETWSYRPRSLSDGMGTTRALPKPGLDLPLRLLADCEAKRSIVVRVMHEFGRQTDGWHKAQEILGDLALVYADHPDYDEAWRP